MLLYVELYGKVYTYVVVLHRARSTAQTSIRGNPGRWRRPVLGVGTYEALEKQLPVGDLASCDARSTCDSPPLLRPLLQYYTCSRSPPLPSPFLQPKCVVLI
jgi:hypothetical protein